MSLSTAHLERGKGEALICFSSPTDWRQLRFFRLGMPDGQVGSHGQLAKQYQDGLGWRGPVRLHMYEAGRILHGTGCHHNGRSVR